MMGWGWLAQAHGVLHGRYSIFDSAPYEAVIAKWLFQQEKPPRAILRR